MQSEFDVEIFDGLKGLARAFFLRHIAATGKDDKLGAVPFTGIPIVQFGRYQWIIISRIRQH